MLKDEKGRRFLSEKYQKSPSFYQLILQQLSRSIS